MWEPQEASIWPSEGTAWDGSLWLARKGCQYSCYWWNCPVFLSDSDRPTHCRMRPFYVERFSVRHGRFSTGQAGIGKWFPQFLVNLLCSRLPQMLFPDQRFWWLETQGFAQAHHVGLRESLWVTASLFYSDRNLTVADWVLAGQASNQLVVGNPWQEGKSWIKFFHSFVGQCLAGRPSSPKLQTHRKTIQAVSVRNTVFNETNPANPWTPGAQVRLC